MKLNSNLHRTAIGNILVLDQPGANGEGGLDAVKYLRAIAAGSG
jgi:hypothetical protein